MVSGATGRGARSHRLVGMRGDPTRPRRADRRPVHGDVREIRRDLDWLHLAAASPPAAADSAAAPTVGATAAEHAARVAPAWPPLPMYPEAYRVGALHLAEAPVVDPAPARPGRAERRGPGRLPVRTRASALSAAQHSSINVRPHTARHNLATIFPSNLPISPAGARGAGAPALVRRLPPRAMPRRAAPPRPRAAVMRLFSHVSRAPQPRGR